MFWQDSLEGAQRNDVGKASQVTHSEKGSSKAEDGTLLAETTALALV